MRIKNNRRNFNIIFFVMFFLIIGVQSGYSQNDNHSLYKGSRAIQFAINNNFTLGSFQNMMYSCKRFRSDNTALRIGIHAKVDFGTENEIRDYLSPNDTTLYTDDADLRLYEFSLNIVRLKYLNTENVFKPYWGLGPAFTMSRSSRNSDYYDGDIDQAFKLEDKNNMWGAGALGLFAIEWFPIKSIGLSAEYGFSLFYEDRENQDDSYSAGEISTSNTEKSIIRFSSNGVTMGASFYF